MERRQTDVKQALRWATIAGAVILVALAAPAVAQKKKVIERFKATAQRVETRKQSWLEIAIYEWSTAEERAAMVEVFKEGGNDALYKYLNKQDDKGFVKVPNKLGYQMRYAYEFKKNGKRQIMLATDRPIAMGELKAGALSRHNNISLVWLDLDAETGKGTGLMEVGVGFSINKKTGEFEIERLGRDPVNFTSVRTEKVKQKD